jgi:bacteriocin-like protein
MTDQEQKKESTISQQNGELSEQELNKVTGGDTPPPKPAPPPPTVFEIKDFSFS